MSKYNHIKNSNIIYFNYIKYGSNNDFYEFILSTLMAKEDSNVNGALRFVKFLKDETQLGLKECKNWYDILRDLGFIISDINNQIFYITDYVNELNSMEDLVYMIEHELTINQFLRISKLKKIKNKMNIKYG